MPRSSPITPAEIEASAYDYIALGHVHVFRDLSQGTTRAFYCGTPAPLYSSDDTGWVAWSIACPANARASNAWPCCRAPRPRICGGLRRRPWLETWHKGCPTEEPDQSWGMTSDRVGKSASKRASQAWWRGRASCPRCTTNPERLKGRWTRSSQRLGAFQSRCVDEPRQGILGARLVRRRLAAARPARRERVRRQTPNSDTDTIIRVPPIFSERGRAELSPKHLASCWACEKQFPTSSECELTACWGEEYRQIVPIR